MQKQENKQENYEMVQICMWHHLGDTIIALNCLYNRYKKTKKQINIMGPSIIGELFEIFDFEGLVYCGEVKKISLKPITLYEALPLSNYEKAIKKNLKTNGVFWFHIFYCEQNYTTTYLNQWYFPKIKILPRESSFDKTYFQFDSRNPSHASYDKKKLEEFIFAWKKNVYGIGGPDTKKYANRPYNIGNLKTIAELLLGAKEFVGSDSGISHLACLLNVKTTIVNRFYISLGIEEMYYCLYPYNKLKVLHLSDLDKFFLQRCKILI